MPASLRPGSRIPLALALLLAAAAAQAATPSSAPGNLGYYRFPALHGDTLVFAAEGDLWRASVAGGLASRLTTHPAEESHPAISPDGATVAFSAAYEGPTEVYTMPIDGGLPIRRTFDGANATVVGWTRAGAILFASEESATLPDLQLEALDPATGARHRLPLAQAADGGFTPDGATLVFTRFAFQGSHTKGYRGGTAQSLWRLDRGASEAVPLTADFPGTSKAPQIWQGRVVFVTDRDGTMNLWSMDLAGHDLRQLTHHQGWDVATPSLADGRIAYKLGADLRLYDLASGVDRALDLRLATDFDQRRETWVAKPMDFVSAISPSPTGDRVALTARGQVFVVPVKQGRRVEVTRNPGVRYRQAVFLPDGKSLAALSDESGEVELWRLPANGVGAGERLSSDGEVLRWEALPSPDGKWIAHTDKNQRLWLLDVGMKTSRLVASSDRDDLRGLAWSPDSQTLAYVAPGEAGIQRIALFHLADGATTFATGERYDSWSPVFSPDGEFLYFLSDRHLVSFIGSPWGPRQPDPFLGAPTGIFGVALHKEYRSPFAPVDELHPEAEKKDQEKESDSAAGEPAAKDAKAAAGKAKSKLSAPAAAKPIDRDGLAERLFRVPVDAGRFDRLMTDGERLYWLAYDIAEEPKAALRALAIRRDKIEPKTVLEEVREAQLSGDRKKLLVRKQDALYVLDAGDKAPDKLDEAKVDLAGWTFSFAPREQWHQMFVEAWRLERDYFWDRGLHGLDWPAIRAKYEPLADRVASRPELSDVLAQMISELGALHMFVGGGDRREGSDKLDVASLGARWERDEAAGGYRLTRLFRADPDQPDERSPLADPQVRGVEGDVLQAIDGVATLSAPDVGALLRGKAGRQVLLHFAGRAGTAARDAIAVPISPDDDEHLRYSDWQNARRERVEKEGRGKLGYVHLSAMGGENFEEWARGFYPAFEREGLIVDVRHNRGGNIDSWILGKLLRKAWFYWQARIGRPTWNMQYAFRGHLVVLVDESTASDGEAFAEGFRRLGLGKVIGTRTWGGEIWLTSSNRLVDKGIATAAEFGVYGPEGRWLIEGHGVDPDLVVDNLPGATFRGEDAQLDAAIHYLQEQIRAAPLPVPPAPAYPRP
ncbi:MAG: S41 family peptidase [Thermoanaerobaculia bacterium]